MDLLQIEIDQSLKSCSNFSRSTVQQEKREENERKLDSACVLNNIFFLKLSGKLQTKILRSISQ